MNYMPQKEAEMVDWGENFTTKVAANAGTWEIPAQEATDVQNAFKDFKDKHLKSHGPEANSVTVAAKNAAKEHFLSLVRNMVNFRFQNPIITDEIRVSVGLHPKDTVRTAIPAPTSRPEYSIKLKDIRSLEIIFHDNETGKRAKPYGVGGALIRYGVGEQSPANIAALNRSVLATHSPWELVFPEEERGKTVYLALCWQNENGKQGNFGEIQSAVIP